MKRMVTAIALISCLAVLPACGSSSTPATAQQKLSESFSVNLTMEMEDFTAEGTLTRYEEGMWSMYFDTPSEVAGVQLDFSGEDVTASYKGLSFSVPQAALPARQLLLQCIQVLDEIAQNPDINGTKKDDRIVLEGELETGDYILSLNTDGTLSDFRMDNMGTSITFHEFQTDVQFTTTTTTIPSLVVTTSQATATEAQAQ